MKRLLSLLFLVCTTASFGQKEDFYGPVNISFHGIICNRPTNDDPLGMDGVGDEVSVHFWNWNSVANNRAGYNGLLKIYGEDFLLPNRIKAGTATVNGGFKAGDSYYREGVYGDENPLILSTYAIVNTFCSENTVISIVPSIWERDKGTFDVTPIQDFGVATNNAFDDMTLRRKIWDFRDTYVYDDSNPYGFEVPGRYIGLDEKYAGMFAANKNKLASRPIGLFSNWDFSSQLLILTSKTIKIISEKDFGYGKGILPIFYNEETMGNTVGHGNYILLLRFVSDIKLRNPPQPPVEVKKYRVGIEVDTVLQNQRPRFAIDGLNTVFVPAGKTTFYFPEKLSTGQQFRVSQIQIAGVKSYQVVQNETVIRDTDIIVKAKAVFPPSDQKIGVRINGVGVGEEFIFSIGAGKQVTVTNGNQVVYFPGTLPTGTNYTISQISGPRPSTLASNKSGTVANSDILVSVDCGTPLTIFYLNITGIVSGEIFSFKYNDRPELRYAFSTKALMGGFPIGETFSITQTNGPRKCIITPPRGTVPDSPLTIDCDCKKITATDPGAATLKLKGLFTAPGGTKVVLQINSKDSVILTQNANSNWLQTNEFSFPKSYAVGSAYTVTIKSAPQNLGCIVYENATGIIDDSTRVRVRCDKSYELVSRSTDDKILSTYYETFTPSVGGIGENEGRYVAFASYGKGIDGSTGNFRQIFIRDRKNGTTKLISKTNNGTEANGNCHVPAIAADGKSVAFESYATNLTSNDNNGARDIYLWQESTGNVMLISKSAGGIAANSESIEPAISGDGSVIAYSSSATNISPDAKDGTNVFVTNVASGISQLVSKDFETGKAAGGSVPSISEDGNKIAFCSSSGRLVANDKNGLWDIFIWENSSPVLKRISLTSTGGERNQGTESSSRVVAPSISGNGNYVVFATTASNMVADDRNEMQDVFMCSTDGGSVRKMSNSQAGDSNGDSPIAQGEKIGISYTGKWITYPTNASNLGVSKGNIILQNAATGNKFTLTDITGISVGRPVISRNGAYVVAGCSEKYDKRFPSSGVFIFYPSGNRALFPEIR